jgi:TolA-binding protein
MQLGCGGCFFLFLLLLVTFAFAALGEEEQLNFAASLYRDGLYDPARQQLRLFLQNFPQSPRVPEAEFLAADSCLRLQRATEAAMSFEAFLNRHPQHPRYLEAQLGLAQAQLQMQDADAAQRIFLEVEQKATDPKILAGAQSGLGDIFYQKGDYSRATLYYGKVLAGEGPRESSPEVLYRRGEAFFRSERFPEAQKSFAAVLESAASPELKRQTRLRLALVVQQAEGAEAARPLLEAIINDPQFSAPGEEASYLLAWGYFQEGQFKEAGEAFKNLINKFPAGEKRKTAMLYLADCLFFRQRYAEGQKAYQDFLTAFPQDPQESRAQWGLIWSLVSEGQEQEAAYLAYKAHQAQMALTVDPLFLQALEALGEKNYPRVLELLPKVITRFPREETYWLMALCYEGLGEPRKAQAALLILQKEFPRGRYGPRALWETARLQYREGLWAASRESIQALLAQGSPDKAIPEAHFLLAQSWEKEHKYQKAEEIYLAAAENYPQSSWAPEALKGAAQSAYAINDYGQALTLYQKSAEKKKDPQNLLGIFLCRLQLKHYEEAGKTLEEMEKLSPPAPEVARAYEEWGKTQATLGHGPEAQKWFLQAENYGPEPPAALFRWSARLARGWSLYHGQAPDAAKELFLQILADSPPPAAAQEAHYALGIYFNNAGNPPAALSHLQAYLDGGPAESAYSQEAWWLLGQNKLKLQDTAGALATFKELIALDPWGPRADMAQLLIEEITLKAGDFIPSLEANPQYTAFNPRVYQDFGAQARRAERLLAQGESAKAQKILEGLLAQKLPALRGEVWPQAQLLLAQSYLPSKPERAQKLLRELGEKFPRSLYAPQALLLLGDLLRERRDYDKALKEYRRVFAGYPQSPPAALALFQTAQCQLALKDEAGALTSLVRLLEDYPQAASLKNRWAPVGLFFQQAGQWERADKALRFALEAAQEPPAQAQAHFYLAENLYLQGSLEAALLEFLKVGYLYPQGGDWVAASKYRAGEIYERKGQLTSAVNLYEKALENLKDESKARELRQKVQNLRQRLGRGNGS